MGMTFGIIYVWSYIIDLHVQGISSPAHFFWYGHGAQLRKLMSKIAVLCLALKLYHLSQEECQTF